MNAKRLGALAAAGVVVTLAGLLLWAGGARWESEAAFLDQARTDGWVEIGQFGRRWPARFRSEQRAYESLAFVREDGSRHRYKGFHGYRLRVAFLEARDGGESIVVMRAARKGRDEAPLLER